jgi:hypothetical protein
MVRCRKAFRTFFLYFLGSQTYNPPTRSSTLSRNAHLPAFILSSIVLA